MLLLYLRLAVSRLARSRSPERPGCRRRASVGRRSPRMSRGARFPTASPCHCCDQLYDPPPRAPSFKAAARFSISYFRLYIKRLWLLRAWWRENSFLGRTGWRNE
ncbi:hypothetical protein CDAR_437501 [Caerostris darwini]|uniref:Secreted protein n=1 Tax=Caerostris darwini TaxID=1538125 RepID=A0AAV4NVX4_9ARAC|nr:hypothetical protein CDAR_437501 [Caerostris darwini]